MKQAISLSVAVAYSLINCVMKLLHTLDTLEGDLKVSRLHPDQSFDPAKL